MLNLCSKINLSELNPAFNETNSENLCSLSTVVSQIVSPDKRKGSAEYWKAKYEQAMSIIDERKEESINIEEIPVVMTIQKVKPKTSKKNTCDTRFMD